MEVLQGFFKGLTFSWHGLIPGGFFVPIVSLGLSSDLSLARNRQNIARRVIAYVGLLQITKSARCTSMAIIGRDKALQNRTVRCVTKCQRQL